MAESKSTSSSEASHAPLSRTTRHARPHTLRARIWAFRGCPGLYLLTHAMPPAVQVEWGLRAFVSHAASEHNNVSNLEKLKQSSLSSSSQCPSRRNVVNNDGGGEVDTTTNDNEAKGDGGGMQYTDASASSTTCTSPSSSSYSVTPTGDLFLNACKAFKALAAATTATPHTSASQVTSSSPVRPSLTSANASSAMITSVSGGNGGGGAATAATTAAAAKQSHAACEELRSLRWASLGFHYDWTARSYHENLRSPFPLRFSRLMRGLATPLFAQGFIRPIWPQTGIVNYYPLGTGMGAHVDDAEPAELQPIVSLSLGAAAVFLIGTYDRAEFPTAIFMRSGTCRGAQSCTSLE